MGSEWIRMKVSDFADVIGGGTPKTKVDEYWHGSIPWLTPKDLSIHSGRYIAHGERFISEEGLRSSSAKILPPRTVLLTTRAPVGYLAISQNEIATNQGFRSLVVKKGFYPEYIYYLLLSKNAHLKRYASGSTFQELSGGTLKSLEFDLPSYEMQRAIAHILGSLDDKIDLNRKMNETLEGIARAIFKSWFVDFDPVRAKADGRDTGLPDEMADLFPDSFQDSELGEIPEGWEISNVGSEFNIKMGQSPPGETYNEEGNGIPFFQGRRDFGFRYPSNRIYCTVPKRFAGHDDTLVSVRAPVGDINMAMEKYCIGRGVAGIRHTSGSRSYTYYAMLNLNDRFARFEAEGTVFGSINNKQFREMSWLSPCKNLVIEFENVSFAFDEQIKKNVNQIKTLSSLRDAFLPKLISGEIRVPDAEKLLEKAGV